MRCFFCDYMANPMGKTNRMPDNGNKKKEKKRVPRSTESF